MARIARRDNSLFHVYLCLRTCPPYSEMFSRKRKYSAVPGAYVPLGKRIYAPRPVAAAAAAAKYIPKPKPGAFARQLRALVSGKKKDATDVTRNTAGQAATTISCLTSSTAFATAASGTGLLDMDGDSALINSVHISQRLQNTTAEDLDPTGSTDLMVRTMIVWFKKPLLVASAAGTLPPVTEVLVADDLFSLVVPSTQNAGRFIVIYDKVDNLGQNSVAAAATGAYPRIGGTRNLVRRDFFVPVGKNCHFKSPGVSGTPSGHYDSDVSPGQVDTGLLVLYTLVYSGNGTCGVQNITRVNYTG